jgi:hypothetical protein
MRCTQSCIAKSKNRLHPFARTADRYWRVDETLVPIKGRIAAKAATIGGIKCAHRIDQDQFSFSQARLNIVRSTPTDGLRRLDFPKCIRIRKGGNS